MAYEYFISYRRQHNGINLSGRIYDLLTDCGQTVFWDKKTIREGKWKTQIEDALTNAKSFIVLITDAFFKEISEEELKKDDFPTEEKPNDWFFYEIDFALKHNLTITPIVYEDGGLFKSIQSGNLQEHFKKSIDKYGLSPNFYDEFRKCCKDEQKLEGNDEDFRKKFCEHFVIKYSPIGDNMSIRKNFAIPDGLVARPQWTSDLLDRIKSNNFTNLTGVGGYGKSSLFKLLCRDHAGEFGYVAYSIIDGDISSAVLEQVRFSEIQEDFSPDNNKMDDENYKDFMVWLSRKCVCNDKINLFVLDINECDKDVLAQFVSDLIRNTVNTMYPLGWKVLVISRKRLLDSKYEFNISNLPKTNNINDSDIDYLCGIFWDNFSTKSYDKAGDFFVVSTIENSCYVQYATEKLKKLLRILYYNPFLVNMVAKKHPKTFEEVCKIIGVTDVFLRNFFNEKVADYINDYNEKRGNSVDKYLDRLVVFSELSVSLKKLMMLFMVWPSIPVSKEAVDLLSKGYFSETDDELKKTLDLAEKEGLLVDLGGKYSLHDLLCKTLIRQFVKKYWVADKNRWTISYLCLKVMRHIKIYPKYKEYVESCKGVMSRNLDDCVPLVGYSLQYDITNRLNNVLDGIYSFYKSANEWLLTIETSDDDSVIADTYMKLAIWSLDYSKRYVAVSANMFAQKSLDYFDKSIALYDKLNKKEDCCKAYFMAGDVSERLGNRSHAYKYYNNCVETVCYNLYWARAYCRLVGNGKAKRDSSNYMMFFDIFKSSPFFLMKDVEKCEYANVFTIFADKDFDNNQHVAMDKYKKAVDLYDELEEDCKLDDFSKNNIATANYRYALLYELTQSDSNEKKPTINKYYTKADRIWESMPVENNGELKGYVKTAYGLYDPISRFKMVKVEGGEFWMGASRDAFSRNYDPDAQDNESPVHKVRLDSFYIAMFPVTKQQWCNLMGPLNQIRKGRKNEDEDDIKSLGHKDTDLYISKIPNGYGFPDNQDDYPASCVSYNDVIEYCKRINHTISGRQLKYTIPTEAQWEFAARGGNCSKRTRYSGSDKESMVARFGERLNQYGEDAKVDSLASVGSLKPNELGIYDMSGNVSEWCLDWFGLYPSFSVSNPEGAVSGEARVLRGGSWDYEAQNCRVSYRLYCSPIDRYYDFGFRLALSFAKH